MNSFLAWTGGKRLLRKTIVERFPKEFERYIEVFGGAGWVLFYKDKHAKLEVYNDINGDLVNLFKCVKVHAPEMQRLMQLELNSRQQFEEYLYLYRNNLPQTDIQRAVNFYLLVKISYGANRRTFGCKGLNISHITEGLAKVRDRLKDVVVENRDFEQLINGYDRENALFYLDPPYYKAERYYNIDFSEEDHKRLKNILLGIKGKFLLSYNDVPFIRELYADFNIETVERNNALANKFETKAKNYRELIITNY